MQTTVTHKIADHHVLQVSVQVPDPVLEPVRGGDGDVAVANIARLRRASEECVNATTLGAVEMARALAVGVVADHDSEATR